MSVSQTPHMSATPHHMYASASASGPQPTTIALQSSSFQLPTSFLQQVIYFFKSLALFFLAPFFFPLKKILDAFSIICSIFLISLFISFPLLSSQDEVLLLFSMLVLCILSLYLFSLFTISNNKKRRNFHSFFTKLCFFPLFCHQFSAAARSAAHTIPLKQHADSSASSHHATHLSNNTNGYAFLCVFTSTHTHNTTRTHAHTTHTHNTHNTHTHTAHTQHTQHTHHTSKHTQITHITTQATTHKSHTQTHTNTALPCVCVCLCTCCFVSLCVCASILISNVSYFLIFKFFKLSMHSSAAAPVAASVSASHSTIATMVPRKIDQQSTFSTHSGMESNHNLSHNMINNSISSARLSSSVAALARMQQQHSPTLSPSHAPSQVTPSSPRNSPSVHATSTSSPLPLEKKQHASSNTTTTSNGSSSPSPPTGERRKGSWEHHVRELRDFKMRYVHANSRPHAHTRTHTHHAHIHTLASQWQLGTSRARAVCA